MANVYNSSVQRVGRVEENGTVYGPAAELVGFVALDGRVFDYGSHVVGSVDREGHLLDARGLPVGEVRPDGGVFNLRHQYVGYLAVHGNAPWASRVGRHCSSCPCADREAAPQSVRRNERAGHRSDHERRPAYVRREGQATLISD